MPVSNKKKISFPFLGTISNQVKPIFKDLPLSDSSVCMVARNPELSPTLLLVNVIHIVSISSKISSGLTKPVKALIVVEVLSLDMEPYAMLSPSARLNDSNVTLNTKLA